VTPKASAKILDALSIPAGERDYAALAQEIGDVRVNNPTPAFPRLELVEEAV
jgi:hypothetical protein